MRLRSNIFHMPSFRHAIELTYLHMQMQCSCRVLRLYVMTKQVETFVRHRHVDSCAVTLSTPTFKYVTSPVLQVTFLLSAQTVLERSAMHNSHQAQSYSIS